MREVDLSSYDLLIDRTTVIVGRHKRVVEGEVHFVGPLTSGLNHAEWCRDSRMVDPSGFRGQGRRDDMREALIGKVVSPEDKRSS